MRRQRHLNRIRKPKVHITYEPERGEQRELPFVVGVIGDFSGDPASPLKRFSEREFTAVERDDLDDKMARQMKPGLHLKVKNVPRADGSDMRVELKFRRMQDFEPSRIVEQVPSLRKLLQIRKKLKDLEENIRHSTHFEEDLDAVLRDNTDVTEQKKRGSPGVPESVSPEDGQTDRRRPGVAPPSTEN